MGGTHAQEIEGILTSGIFFVKDRVDKNKISIQYCPTGEMLADFFTKALQGQKFHLFRNVLMGYSHISTLSENVSSIKERVEIPVIK